MSIFDLAARAVIAFAPALLLMLPRDIWPMMSDGNVERVIRAYERDTDAFEAKIWLERMGK